MGACAAACTSTGAHRAALPRARCVVARLEHSLWWLSSADPCCELVLQVVLMPYEKATFPCCCCVNRVNWNENCCGFCGPPTGNPKVYTMLAMQPKDPWAFVAEANKQFKCTRESQLSSTPEPFDPPATPMLSKPLPRFSFVDPRRTWNGRDGALWREGEPWRCRRRIVKGFKEKSAGLLAPTQVQTPLEKLTVKLTEVGSANRRVWWPRRCKTWRTKGGGTAAGRET